MGKVSMLKDIWGFLRARGKWWLVPIILIFLLFSFVMVFVEGSALSPFIYAIF